MDLIRDAPCYHILDNPKQTVCSGYAGIAKTRILNHEIVRIVQEFSYPDVYKAVPRYYNSSNSQQEWIERRRRLMSAWTCPVVLIQGYDSPTQPRELFEGVEKHIPNAANVELIFVPGGHFSPLESPSQVIGAIEAMLKRATA